MICTGHGGDSFANVSPSIGILFVVVPACHDTSTPCGAIDHHHRYKLTCLYVATQFDTHAQRMMHPQHVISMCLILVTHPTHTIRCRNCWLGVLLVVKCSDRIGCDTVRFFDHVGAVTIDCVETQHRFHIFPTMADLMKIHHPCGPHAGALCDW